MRERAAKTVLGVLSARGDSQALRGTSRPPEAAAQAFASAPGGHAAARGLLPARAAPQEAWRPTGLPSGSWAMERSVQGLSPESRPRGGSAAGPGLCSAAAASAPSPSAGLQGPSRWCQDGVRGSPGLAAQSRPSPRPPVQTLQPHGPRPLCSHALWPDPRSPPGARAVFLLSRSLSPAPRRAWRCPGRRGGDPARGSGGHRHQRARILDVGNGARGPSWSHSPWGRGCGLVSACQADDGADRHLAHFRLPPRLAWARQAGRVRLCPEGLNQTHTRVPIAHAPSGLLGARVRRVPTCAWSHHPPQGAASQG